MAKFKFISKADASVIFAERWVPEKGTTVDGIEESLDREGQLVGYHTVDTHGNTFAVYSGDYIVSEGGGYRPYGAGIFPEKFHGLLPHGRVVSPELFLVVDILGTLLEELMPGSGLLWNRLIESMYENPNEAKKSFGRLIQQFKDHGTDTTTLEQTMDSLQFFDPAHN